MPRPLRSSNVGCSGDTLCLRPLSPSHVLSPAGIKYCYRWSWKCLEPMKRKLCYTLTSPHVHKTLSRKKEVSMLLLNLKLNVVICHQSSSFTKPTIRSCWKFYTLFFAGDASWSVGCTRSTDFQPVVASRTCRRLCGISVILLRSLPIQPCLKAFFLR